MDSTHVHVHLVCFIHGTLECRGNETGQRERERERERGGSQKLTEESVSRGRGTEKEEDCERRICAR